VGKSSIDLRKWDIMGNESFNVEKKAIELVLEDNINQKENWPKQSSTLLTNKGFTPQAFTNFTWLAAEANLAASQFPP